MKIRATFRLSDDLLQTLKVHAALRKVSLQQLVEEGLRAWFASSGLPLIPAGTHPQAPEAIAPKHEPRNGVQQHD